MRVKYSGRTLKKFGKIILKKTETKVEEKNSQFKGERETFAKNVFFLLIYY